MSDYKQRMLNKQKLLAKLKSQSQIRHHPASPSKKHGHKQRKMGKAVSFRDRMQQVDADNPWLNAKVTSMNWGKKRRGRSYSLGSESEEGSEEILSGSDMEVVEDVQKLEEQGQEMLQNKYEGDARGSAPQDPGHSKDSWDWKSFSIWAGCILGFIIIIIILIIMMRRVREGRRIREARQLQYKKSINSYEESKLKVGFDPVPLHEPSPRIATPNFDSWETSRAGPSSPIPSPSPSPLPERFFPDSSPSSLHLGDKQV